MESEYISRQEHEEFAKRMSTENQLLAEENKRQNRRIDALEQITQQIGALTLSVERLATNMENMLRSIEAHGKQLEALEGRDGEMWRKVAAYAATTLVGGVIGFFFRQIGM